MPARNMEAAVGADEWPSGTHVCNGKMAVKTPKPINNKGKKSIFPKISEGDF